MALKCIMNVAIKLHNKHHYHIKNLQKFKSFIMDQHCFLLQAYISFRIKIVYTVVLQVTGYWSCATVSSVHVNTLT